MSHRLGRWGEQVAADHYRSLGFEVLEQNWRSRHGEIDLVCRRTSQIVFVEVKARRSRKYGPPEDGLGARQQLRIQKAAWDYLRAHDLLDSDWQVDFVAIERNRDGSIGRLERYPNAVSAQDLD